MTKMQKVGLVLVAAPIPLFILNLLLWFISRLIVPLELFRLVQVLNVFFGLVGIVAVIGMMPGIPVGIILLIVGMKRPPTP